MSSSAISHLPLKQPDWFAITLLPNEPAADALRSILAHLEGLEDTVFAIRGLACYYFAERRLYEQFEDPDVGQPFRSMDRFLKASLPKSWRYCEDAWSAIKAVKDQLTRGIPDKDLAEMPRCNLVQLKQVSSGVRGLPDVVEAAKTLPETEFTAKLNREHNQHLEGKQTLKFTYSAAEAAIILHALDIVGELTGLDPQDRNGELLAWAIDYAAEHETVTA